MLRGLPASIILHAVAIAAAVIGLPYAGSSLSATDSVAVPIELVDAGLLTDIAPVPEEAEQAPETTPEAPTIEEPDLEEFLDDVDTLPELDADQAEDIVDPEPSLDPLDNSADNREFNTEPIVPRPNTEPVEEDTKTPEPVTEDPEPEVAAPDKDAEPVIEPPKTEPKKQQAAPPPDPLKDLLSNSRQSLGNRRNSRSENASSTSSGRSRALSDETAAPRRGAGERERAIASFSDIVKTQMEFCWADVVDLPDYQRLVVTLKVTLNADGTLARDPQLISPRSAPIGDRYMQIAIDRAVDATFKCVPYKLPPEDYDLWRELDFKVGPKSG